MTRTICTKEKELHTHTHTHTHAARGAAVIKLLLFFEDETAADLQK